MLVFENHHLGLRSRLLLFWFWDRCDEVRLSAGLDDALGRLSLVIQFPMPGRLFVRRIENWLIEEWVGHVGFLDGGALLARFPSARCGDGLGRLLQKRVQVALTEQPITIYGIPLHGDGSHGSPFAQGVLGYAEVVSSLGGF